MKRILIRWLVIIVAFFASLFAFNILMNRGTTDMTIDMPEATLPVISVLYGDKSVNTMYGYTERMDAGTMRDSISPIGEERSLSFTEVVVNEAKKSAYRIFPKLPPDITPSVVGEARIFLKVP